MNTLLNLRGRLLDLSTPAVMGILNITPDSFHDGGAFSSIDAAISHTAEMLKAGAALIDVGAQSTRPGAAFLDAETEWGRLSKVLPALVRAFPDAHFSIDTFHSEVVRRAVEHGCCMVNDVSGGTLDSRMFETVGSLQVPYVLMHMQGTPSTMQHAPVYSDVIAEVFDHLLERRNQLREAGVKDVLLDPGFGFGKTLQQNYLLLHALSWFAELDCPLLVGLSRKSMVNKVLGTTPENALNGTTVLNTLALEQGASVLRVHDVREAVDAVRLTHYYQECVKKGISKPSSVREH